MSKNMHFLRRNFQVCVPSLWVFVGVLISLDVEELSATRS